MGGLWRRAICPARIVALLALVAMVAACAAATDRSPDSSTAEDGGRFPITITHAFGTATIESPPERIVTMGEDLDTLAALEITPVGYAPTAPGYDDEVPYLRDKVDLSDSEILEGAETGEFNVGQIAQLHPDLILASNLAPMDDSLYRILSKMAPTLAYTEGWGQTSWQDMSRTIGRAVGQEAKADRAVAATDRYLANLETELPGLQGKTVAGAYYYGTGTFAANPRSASMSKYTDLGMRVSSELLTALPKGSDTNTISMERIDVLDTDFLVISFGSVALRRELMNNPLFRSLDVVKAGHVYEIDTSDALPTFAGNAPTLLNIPWLLDQEKQLLTKVAAG